MQLLHFGLLRTPMAEVWDYEEIPLSFLSSCEVGIPESSLINLHLPRYIRALNHISNCNNEEPKGETLFFFDLSSWRVYKKKVRNNKQRKRRFICNLSAFREKDV